VKGFMTAVMNFMLYSLFVLKYDRDRAGSCAQK